MLTYKRCTKTDEDTIYQAFQSGFSDYIIKMEIPKDLFIKRFFGPEGNSYEYSYIALDEEKPVGLILGGIKVYEGIKTLRCGALCVHPDYRGTEVAKRLFLLHKEIALDHSCKQLFLEVIVGNDRAIHFYKKMGYEKIYDIVYYSNNQLSDLKSALSNEVKIEKIDFEVLSTLRFETQDIHINWQNDFDYISHSEGFIHYGVLKDSRLIGGLSIHPAGKINFLWIRPEFRNKGIGSGLLYHVSKELKLEKLVMNFPNNASLIGFLKHLHFTKDPISQYEMYLTL